MDRGPFQARTHRRQRRPQPPQPKPSLVVPVAVGSLLPGRPRLAIARGGIILVDTTTAAALVVATTTNTGLVGQATTVAEVPTLAAVGIIPVVVVVTAIGTRVATTVDPLMLGLVVMVIARCRRHATIMKRTEGLTGDLRNNLRMEVAGDIILRRIIDTVTIPAVTREGPTRRRVNVVVVVAGPV